jgi:hypothetical protein
MVRMRRETLARLRSIIGGLDRAREHGVLRHAEPGEQGWSNDQLIEYLLGTHERHRTASRLAGQRRTERRKAKKLEAIITSASEPLFSAPEGAEGGG